jgi:hypothetical protein
VVSAQRSRLWPAQRSTGFAVSASGASQEWLQLERMARTILDATVGHEDDVLKAHAEAFAM